MNGIETILAIALTNKLPIIIDGEVHFDRGEVQEKLSRPVRRGVRVLTRSTDTGINIETIYVN